MSKNVSNKRAEPNLNDLGPDLYQAIFRYSREPVAIIDPQGYYLEQNAAHAQLLGYTDAELRNLTPAIHLGEEVFAEVARTLAQNGEYRGEVVSKTKQGETRHLELSAFAMRTESGEPLCFVGIKRDITERKRTETRLTLQYAVTEILSQSRDFIESAARILKAACDSLDWEVGALWRVDR